MLRYLDPKGKWLRAPAPRPALFHKDGIPGAGCPRQDVESLLAQRLHVAV